VGAVVAVVVNRHRGGAVLLDEPEVIYDIIKAVRAAVPSVTPVTAKMRLGYKDKSRALECALAIENAGAAQLTVHARTKIEGYKPPAHWDWIARIRETVKLPVVANGEVWTVADWHDIRAASACDAVMIGRGLVASPGLALAIKAESGMEDKLENTAEPIGLLAWPLMIPVLQDFFAQCRAADQQYAVGRLKQWLAQLKRTYPEAEQLFARIKEERQAEIVGNIVDGVV
ncbi:MAG: tRNA-dihydrouridine synthase family protein, partial [Glaciimonas sp.]|nr:tRNA-dihydrouridine synthase family protein [Glaciimonas sp.]